MVLTEAFSSHFPILGIHMYYVCLNIVYKFLFDLEKRLIMFNLEKWVFFNYCQAVEANRSSITFANSFFKNSSIWRLIIKKKIHDVTMWNFKVTKSILSTPLSLWGNNV